MNLLVDTNILVDVLRKRDQDFAASRLLLALGKVGEFELWISPSQLSDLFYILSGGGKKSLKDKVAAEMSDLLQFLHVATFGDADARAALQLGWDDLEDALVCQAARAVRAECIITRNQADFAKSNIAARSSTEFLDWYATEYGIHYADIQLCIA